MKLRGRVENDWNEWDRSILTSIKIEFFLSLSSAFPGDTLLSINCHFVIFTFLKFCEPSRGRCFPDKGGKKVERRQEISY